MLVETIYDNYEINKFGVIRNKKTKRIIAQRLNHNGYSKCCISVDGNTINVRVHRLVCSTFLGDIEGKEIDHIDGNRANNYLENLRVVSKRENAQNQKKHRGGKVVGYFREGNKFRSCVSVGGKTIHIGTYTTMQDASNAYFDYVNNLG